MEKFVSAASDEFLENLQGFLIKDKILEKMKDQYNKPYELKRQKFKATLRN